MKFIVHSSVLTEVYDVYVLGISFFIKPYRSIQPFRIGTGFDSNSCIVAPEGLLDGLRSYTFLLTTNMKTKTKQPRLYDFGSGSGNSLFLR